MRHTTSIRGLCTLCVFLTASLFSCCRYGLALEAAEILVIANSNVYGSTELAKYYLHSRSIPDKNLVTLRTTKLETCSRTQYNKEIREPVLQYLRQRMKTQRIRCLVTVYGLPLRIGSNAKEENEQKTTRAAVDSELALILSGDYPLDGWQPNPYFLGFQRQNILLKRDNVLMVSRLDGPDLKTVRRVIDHSLKAETIGLRGRACIDARWPRKDQGNLQGYALYDASLHKTAEIIAKDGQMEVNMDSKERLFSEGECPQTALYCGWYSLTNYVDAFTWQQGAIGFHIASGECTTLKNPKSNAWCKRMLEDGIAATIGPVYEPYVQGFPLPDIFFRHLIDGYLSLAESYLVSLPFLSWQMILIGDPLYMPFKPINKDDIQREKKQHQP